MRISTVLLAIFILGNAVALSSDLPAEDAEFRKDKITDFARSLRRYRQFHSLYQRNSLKIQRLLDAIDREPVAQFILDAFYPELRTSQLERMQKTPMKEVPSKRVPEYESEYAYRSRIDQSWLPDYSKEEYQAALYRLLESARMGDAEREEGLQKTLEMTEKLRAWDESKASAHAEMGRLVYEIVMHRLSGMELSDANEDLQRIDQLRESYLPAQFASNIHSHWRARAFEAFYFGTRHAFLEAGEIDPFTGQSIVSQVVYRNRDQIYGYLLKVPFKEGFVSQIGGVIFIDAPRDRGGDDEDPNEVEPPVPPSILSSLRGL